MSTTGPFLLRAVLRRDDVGIKLDEKKEPLLVVIPAVKEDEDDEIDDNYEDGHDKRECDPYASAAAAAFLPLDDAPESLRRELRSHCAFVSRLPPPTLSAATATAAVGAQSAGCTRTQCGAVVRIEQGPGSHGRAVFETHGASSDGQRFKRKVVVYS